MWRPALVSGLSALLLLGCSETDIPTAVVSEPPPSFQLSDGMHGGNRHFFFLPPMVSAPSYSGVFDGSLAPVVEICEWTTSGCAEPLVARYTTTSGPGSETVRVDADSEQYVVNWHTDQFGLSTEHTYRIRVLVAGTPLGYADVKLYSDGKAARNTSTDTDIALVDGRTLPVKFRIERGAVYVVSGAAGGTLTSADGSVALDFAPGALEGEVGITVQPTVLSAADRIQMIEGGAFEFQPSPLTFAEPVTLAITYDPAKLPAGTEVGDLRLFRAHRLADGRSSWRAVPGSGVVAGTQTVSGSIESFSHYGVGVLHEILSYFDAMFASCDAGDAGRRAFHVTNEDGTGHAELSAAAPLGAAPDWSPDASQIVFVSCREGQQDPVLHIMNADGSGARSLNVIGRNPDWSPDGTKILFERDGDILTVQTDGTGETLLTTVPDGGMWYWGNASLWSPDPAWSPDGTRIAYAGLPGGDFGWNHKIFTMNADGSGATQISAALAGSDENPEWSPDGTKIAYTCGVGAEGVPSGEAFGGYICVLSADGTGDVLQVGFPEIGTARSPAWSPDGAKIAFSTYYWDQTFRINLINADGSGLTEVTAYIGCTDCGYFSPAWKP